MDRDDDKLPGGQSGFGVSLWPRVATAASTLTIFKTYIRPSDTWGIIAHVGLAEV